MTTQPCDPVTLESDAAHEHSDRPDGVSQATAKLRIFSTEVGERGVPDLKQSIEAYADRVDRAQRGDLPTAAAQVPGGLRPDIVGAVLVPGNLESKLEIFRNIFIFLPVLWTWWELRNAVEAYGQMPFEAAELPFITLWQQGFDGTTRTLGGTALVTVLILVIIIGMTFLIGVSRVKTSENRVRKTAEFAATLAEASAITPGAEAATPNERLVEFARAGERLTSELRDLTSTMRDSTRSSSDTMRASQASIADVSSTVKQQSEQLASVTTALERIAKANAALDPAHAAIVDAAAALERIHGSMAPSMQSLIGLATELGKQTTHAVRAMENFEAMTGEQSDLTSALDSAARSLNTVANRVIEELDQR